MCKPRPQKDYSDLQEYLIDFAVENNLYNNQT